MPTRLIALDRGPDISLLEHAPTLMGRDPRCDARLDSLRVSRFHCCVTPIEDGAHVSDLGSTNGTRINGRCVKSGRLRPGDELTIAHLRYRVEGTRPGSRAESDQVAEDSQVGASEVGAQSESHG
jgi:pSer/pThr/pTyr-binding forkhead associated (FHA) protein